MPKFQYDLGHIDYDRHNKLITSDIAAIRQDLGITLCISTESDDS